ncbi:MAG: hypothetical protein ACAI25_17270 [Planctomycetota bacterium]
MTEPAPKKRWQCGECAQEWRGTVAVSGSCPTCRSSMVKEVPEPAVSKKKVAALALIAVFGAAKVGFHLAGHSVMEGSKIVVRDFLYWVNEHLR